MIETIKHVIDPGQKKGQNALTYIAKVHKARKLEQTEYTCNDNDRSGKKEVEIFTKEQWDNVNEQTKGQVTMYQ